MKRSDDRFNWRIHTIGLMIAILSLIFMAPAAGADTFSELKGYWSEYFFNGKFYSVK